MRFSILLLSTALGLALTSDSPAQTQDPGAQQDAEAAREKLLKASDQLDNIQANSEATKTSVDGMKSQIVKLQADVTTLETTNASLKQQVTDLQTALDQFKEEQIKARQALIDNVAGMIATGKSAPKPKIKKESSETGTALAATTEANPPSVGAGVSSLAPPPDTESSASGNGAAASANTSPPPVKPHKGYYHVVADGETLTLICAAYRDNGVNVTVPEVRKANGLTDKSVLKVGQKLFIPKPGT